MKKVIRLNESNLTKIVTKIIKEQEMGNISLYLRRRLGTISEILGKMVDDPNSDPLNFSDEFEYADNILSWTIQDLIREFNDGVIEEKEDEVMDYLKEIYGDHLFEIYHSEIESEDDYEDFEELD
jgi:hypothetical protein